MNLFFTITSFPPALGGAQLHLQQLIQQLGKHHSINIATLWNKNRTDWLLGTTIFASDPGNKYFYHDLSVQIIGLTSSQKLRLIPEVSLYYFYMNRSAHKIAEAFNEQLDEIGHSAQIIHNIRLGREPISIASYQFAKRKKIPFVFTPLHHPRWVGFLYRVYHQIYREADALMALTMAEKEYLISTGVKPERVHVTGHGPILAESAEPSNFLPDKQKIGPIVLFLGQHYEYKGYRQVLQAAELVWQKRPEVQFVFIGPPIRKSEEYFKQYLDSRIIRMGLVNLQTKTNALAACTLLCVPSLQESFGGVYTEAWSFKKPVIGCPIPAVSEVISDGVDGYLANQEPQEISKRIIYLLENPSIADQLGMNGYKKVSSRYSWEHLAELTEKVYQTVLS